MKTTVAIPLHRSQRWSQVVAGNIERLGSGAHLVISDATGEDDAFQHLKKSYGRLSDITWLGPRRLSPGWVAHCNDLQARCTTEFFMWLPHDDEIDAEWVTRGEDALARTSGAVLALGILRTLDGEDRQAPSRLTVPPHGPFASDVAADRLREAIRICLTGRKSLLGAAFRGIQRRDRAVPLPDTEVDGAWADMFWATRLLAAGSFVGMSATYWKRCYDGSTYTSWTNLRSWPNLRTHYLPAALVDLAPDERERLLTEAWTAEVDELRRHNARLRADATPSLLRPLAAPRRVLGRIKRSIRP